MAKEYLIYFHINPIKNEVFYVGKGSLKRAYTKHSRNDHWKKTVNKYGFVVDVIESNLTEDEAFEREKYWIKKIGRRDLGLGSLVNMTDGGIGIPKLSEYVRKNMSESAKKNKNFLGKKHTPQTIAKIVAKNKGRIQSVEEKEMRSKILSETHKNNPDIAIKLSNKLKEIKHRCKKIHQYSIDGEFINEFFSIKEASKILNISRTGINNNVKNHSKSSGGFIFKYA